MPRWQCRASSSLKSKVNWSVCAQIVIQSNWRWAERWMVRESERVVKRLALKCCTSIRKNTFKRLNRWIAEGRNNMPVCKISAADCDCECTYKQANECQMQCEREETNLNFARKKKRCNANSESFESSHFPFTFLSNRDDLWILNFIFDACHQTFECHQIEMQITFHLCERISFSSIFHSFVDYYFLYFFSLSQTSFFPLIEWPAARMLGPGTEQNIW